MMRSSLTAGDVRSPPNDGLMHSCDHLARGLESALHKANPYLWRSLPYFRSGGRRSSLESAPIYLSRARAVLCPVAPPLKSALQVVRVTRLRAEPRSTAPPMASDARNSLHEKYEAEFNTLREEMDALGIGARA